MLSNFNKKIKRRVYRFNNALIPRYIEKLSIENKNFDPQDTIILCGAPRSGTTWMMEFLSNIQGYTGIYEPLLTSWFPEAKEAGFTPRPYFSPSFNDNQKTKYLINVFKGNIKSTHPVYDFTLGNIFRRIIANKLIVKFVRANRLLPWIATNVDVKAIVLLVRHPLNVIASQMKTGFRGYMLPKNISPDILSLLKEMENLNLDSNTYDKIKYLKTEEEILALIWALDHIIPFEFENPALWHTLCYEDLVLDGEATIKNFLKMHDLNIKSSHYSKLKKLSIRNQDKTTSVRLYSEKWKNYFTQSQVKNIKKVLNLFEIDFDENRYQIKNNSFPTI